MASSAPVVPDTRVISPSPTPSESSGKNDGYFGPVTRSMRGQKKPVNSPAPIDEDSSSGSERDPEKRARARSRSPILDGHRRRLSGLTSRRSIQSDTFKSRGSKNKPDPMRLAPNEATEKTNGHLSPESAAKQYWRAMSRSPSPLGLIPIHTEWRTFVHKHEIPRKVLHVSIGFVAIALYTAEYQPSHIHPLLLGLLVPIFLIDVLRHRHPRVNRLYIRLLGALMRESEVDGWNGTISYVLGAWLVMLLCPKDVGVMSVLLLSWCDTAASTFGRLYGRYTPQVRKGKSLAGTIAALVMGIATAGLFYGVIAPQMPEGVDSGKWSFAFDGTLTLPTVAQDVLGWTGEQSTIRGGAALAVMSVWAGVVGCVSEAIDLWGWDDNVTIPVLCGAGLWAFLRVFGSG